MGLVMLDAHIEAAVDEDGGERLPRGGLLGAREHLSSFAQQDGIAAPEGLHGTEAPQTLLGLLKSEPFLLQASLHGRLKGPDEHQERFLAFAESAQQGGSERDRFQSIELLGMPAEDMPRQTAQEAGREAETAIEGSQARARLAAQQALAQNGQATAE